NPIGRRVRFSPDGPRVEVVGVARDGKYYFVWEEPRPMVFRPIAQDVPVSATLIAQTGGPPADLLESVRRALHDVDPEVPVITVQTMASHLEFGNAFIIFRMGAATYASVTLVLVAVALAASLVPARRAVSVDPLESLRVD